LSFQSDVVIVERGGHRAPPQQSRRGHAEYLSFRYLFSDPARRASALRAFVEATVRDAVRSRASSLQPLTPSLPSPGMEPSWNGTIERTAHPGIWRCSLYVPNPSDADLGRACLSRSSSEPTAKVPCRLETSDPANVSHYHRFGSSSTDRSLRFFAGVPL
jgi:hypothetical protein